MAPQFLRDLLAIVGGKGLLTERQELRTYECDGLTNFRVVPAAVVLPTTAEQGFPSVQISHWAGLFAPKGTPQAILDKMNAALQQGMKSKEIVDKLVPQGIEPTSGPLPQFVQFINTERERLGKLIKKAGMTAE